MIPGVLLDFSKNGISDHESQNEHMAITVHHELSPTRLTNDKVLWTQKQSFIKWKLYICN